MVEEGNGNGSVADSRGVLADCDTLFRTMKGKGATRGGG